MISFSHNLKQVIGQLERTERLVPPRLVVAARKLDWLAAAAGALDALMLPEEKRFATYMLAGVLPIGIDMGFQLPINVPPPMAERARLAAKALRFPGRAGKRAAEGRPEGFGQFRNDLEAMKELVRMWVEAPQTTVGDPLSGKIRDGRDAGYDDEAIIERLEWILGITTSRGQFIRPLGVESRLALARASLSHALDRFYIATFGEPSVITQDRILVLLRGVLMAWLELLRVNLPRLAREVIAKEFGELTIG